MTLERILPVLLEAAGLILLLAWMLPHGANMVRAWLAEPSYWRRVMMLTFAVVGFVVLEALTRHLWPDSWH